MIPRTKVDEFHAQQAEAFAELQKTPLLKPAFFEIGMGYNHNMPCCVHHSSEPAVLDTSVGVFMPSWRAQREGWQLVKADTKFKRWLLQKFFIKG